MARRTPVTSPSATDEHPDPLVEPDLRSLPPRTPYEDAIVGILSDILGCQDPDVHDGLLTLGDVSQVPRVVAQIRKTMGVDIPVADYLYGFALLTLAMLLWDAAAPKRRDPAEVAGIETTVSSPREEAARGARS